MASQNADEGLSTLTPGNLVKIMPRYVIQKMIRAMIWIFSIKLFEEFVFQNLFNRKIL